MNLRGLTLPELVLLLLILGIGVHFSFAPLKRQIDTVALSAVRDEVVALFHRARMEARLRGRSSLIFSDGGDPHLLSPERPPLRLPISDRGVSLEVAGSRTAVEIDYGPLGIASVASATLILRRGGAETRLVVSSYGRVRR